MRVTAWACMFVRAFMRVAAWACMLERVYKCVKYGLEGVYYRRPYDPPLAQHPGKFIVHLPLSVYASVYAVQSPYSPVPSSNHFSSLFLVSLAIDMEGTKCIKRGGNGGGGGGGAGSN